MRIFKHLIDFYINSSIHVALAVFSLSWITLNAFDILYDEALLSFIFYATITGYNFVKYYGIVKRHHRRLTKWLRPIQIFSMLCFVLMCYYAFKLPIKTLIIISGFGLLNFLYAFPFLPRKLYLDTNQNLRSISGLKVYLIALVWSGVTVILPIVNNGFDFNADVGITFCQRFIFVLALMLPFEIRDLQYDSLKLATIPQKIGAKNTKVMGVLLLIVFLLLEFLKTHILVKHVTVIATIACITLLFIVFSKKEQGEFYSAFWVEGLPILWMLLLYYLG